MSLVEEMANAKINNAELKHFANLSYSGIMKVVNPEVFYQKVRSASDLKAFLQAVNFYYCQEKHLIPSKILFKKLDGNELANTSYLKTHEINVNENLDKMLDIVVQHQNKYFPYLLFETMIHETTHTCQHNAGKTNDYSNLSFENKVAAMDMQLSFLQFNALLDGTISTNAEQNEILNKLFTIDEMKKNHELSVNKHYDYGNNPLEIVAREEGITECEKLLNNADLNPENLYVFKQFIKISQINHKALTFGNNFSGYSLLNNIIKGDLFSACPNIKNLRQVMCDLIDEKFTEFGGITINRLDQNEYLQELPNQFEYLKKYVNSKEMSEKEYMFRCDLLEKKAVKKQEHLCEQIDSQFINLFPKTAKLQSDSLAFDGNSTQDVLRFFEIQKFFVNKQSQKR